MTLILSDRLPRVQNELKTPPLQREAIQVRLGNCDFSSFAAGSRMNFH
jgi:hypothetical protein